MNRWLTCRRRLDAPAIRLYCLPHAGGSAGEYLRWADALPRTEVWGVNLPGRVPRHDEPPVTEVGDLVGVLVEEVAFAGPYALFGHSFGGLVAYELAQRLRGTGREQPDRLVLSGCPPPHVPRALPPVSGLPDEQFLDVVRQRYGPETAALLADPDLRDLALPGFRGDLAALERYAWPSHPPLDRPLWIVSGDRDELAGRRLAEWARHTTAECALRLLPGGHFYFRERPEAMTAALTELLEAPAGRPA